MKKLFYRVKKEDSISSVAKRFGLPACKIISINSLEREIEAGDILYLEIDESKRLYRVEVGDSLQSLAKKFNVSPNSILEENGIEGIYFGEEIIVP